MRDLPVTIRDNQALSSCYQQLQANDIICGRIRMRQGEEHILLDLLERGVHLIPSASSQLASRSKSFQARVFEEFMLPGTLAIYNSYDLLQASSLYKEQQYSRVIVKSDRKNAGLGIHLYHSVEEVYNQASHTPLPYPFVIQPFQEDHRDIRVVILGDYLEAYERHNPHNFRKNLHCGGHSSPCTLSDSQLDFCMKVMHRGDFPYGHLDLLLTRDGGCYLMEINLRGGLKGAKLSPKTYQEKLEAIHETLLEKFSAPSSPPAPDR